ncbi:MAG: acyltransferase [Planctomycetota bacterium]
MLTSEATERPGRLYELDWLRVLVIINLVPWHAAYMMTSVPEFSHIPKDAFSASVLRYYTVFFSRWQMPLMFFIAGASACISLAHRSPKAFAMERVRRLLVPLAFFMVVFYPLFLYFWPEASQSKSLSDYLLRFWPHCLSTIYYSSFPGRYPMPGWGHLWFVAYLSIFSLIILPLFVHLRSRVNIGSAARYATLLAGRGGIILLGLPLVLVNMGLTPKWPMAKVDLYDDWAYFCYNLTAFLYGYMLCRDQRFWQSIDRYLKILLPLAVLLTSLVVFMRFEMPEFSKPAYTSRYMFYSLFFGFHTWFCILAAVALAKRFLRSTNRFLDYFSRASYPFYILHLVVMSVIGHYIVQWRMGVLAEFVILSLLCFAVTIVSFELLVDRLRITRFLFGVKS